MSVFAAVSCGTAKKPATEQAQDGYKLVWSDEFDGTELDMTKWSMEEGYIANNELQDYKKSGNHTVSDGTLKIECKMVNDKEEFGSYTSARMNTSKKFSFTYGKIEARLKMPTGRGTWPAFWLLGESIHEGAGWPACGEVDIMEYLGCNPGEIHGTLHTKDFNHSIGTSRGDKTMIENEEDWHVYGAIWTEDKIQIYVDDKIYFTCDAPAELPNKGAWPFDAPHFIILNYAFGGWGAVEGLDNTIFEKPSIYEVDYVRVYQK